MPISDSEILDDVIDDPFKPRHSLPRDQSGFHPMDPTRDGLLGPHDPDLHGATGEEQASRTSLDGATAGDAFTTTTTTTTTTAPTTTAGAHFGGSFTTGSGPGLTSTFQSLLDKQNQLWDEQQRQSRMRQHQQTLPPTTFPPPPTVPVSSGASVSDAAAVGPALLRLSDALVGLNVNQHNLYTAFQNQSAGHHAAPGSGRGRGRGGGGSAGGASHQPPTPPRHKEVTPDVLSDCDAIKWSTFRRNFSQAMALNQWPNDRAVLMLYVSLKDAAARAVQHLQEDTDQDIEDVLDEMEQVFVDPSATQHFTSLFQIMEREQDETLVLWHTRLREVFLRANPDWNHKEETSLVLKDRFALHINNLELSLYLKQLPNQSTIRYTELLTKAREFLGNQDLAHRAYGKTALPSQHAAGISQLDATVAALHQGVRNLPEGGKCHFCKMSSHPIRDCTLFTSAIDRIKRNPKAFGLMFASSNQRSTSLPPRMSSQNSSRQPRPQMSTQRTPSTNWRGSSRGSRGSSSGRRRPFFRSRGNFRPRINALEDDRSNSADDHSHQDHFHHRHHSTFSHSEN